jgi:hypothetical protein
VIVEVQVGCEDLPDGSYEFLHGCCALDKPRLSDPLMGLNAACELPETPGRKIRVNAASTKGKGGMSQTYRRFLGWLISTTEWEIPQPLREMTRIKNGDFLHGFDLRFCTKALTDRGGWKAKDSILMM